MTQTNANQPATIRAIHIDPFARTVTEIQMVDDFDTMKRDLLHCHLAECVHLGGGVDAWMDEEGTLGDWDHQAWFRLSDQVTFAGPVVLCGVHQGAMSGLHPAITVPLVQGLCHWLDPRDVALPGTTLTTFDANGRPSTEHLGPEVRTYEDH